MKCRLEIKVVPGASRTELVGWLGDTIKIKVAAPPEKGKANQAVIALLAKTVHISEDSIRIVYGSSTQRKVVEIKGIDENQLNQSLPSKPV